jgi:predicted pyridoxine 5'-phosphate oxidase superfamily flavin-nucleotide-binding protein
MSSARIAQAHASQFTITMTKTTENKLPGSKGEHLAQAKYDTTRRALAFYNKQMLTYLNPLMCEFIGQQELLFIATSDAQGECDCSLRAGHPGFVKVLDEKTLVYPEYRGNGVMASVGNILENPHIGMIFIDFFQHTVGLHVNGKACVVENDELAHLPNVSSEVIEESKICGGRSPERWILVEVEEAYIHCSKHIPLLQKLDKKIHWGTDDMKHKGGDAFKAKDCSRPWNQKVVESDIDQCC